MSVRKKAIDYLSRREHSRFELKQKLLVKNFPEKEIETELNFLSEKDLQSDSRFAHAYVRSRKQAGFGPIRIAAELRERGVNEKLIAEAVDAHSADWQTQLLTVWKHKFANPPKNQTEKAEQFRFLSYRGYSFEIINMLFHA
ncbi:MAG TPA: regulatory protein RecX [Coxiellaceae bacterium]|nr:MAG: hypothetical protein A3E81_06155 [Gammaproteobacteria bacterium RIFCSPHIGHO2_12_FULL_36_30]HLB56868.1 regulatory protein RecX [Coxiellaceae bacterium]